MRWQGRGRSISRCIEGLGDETAQATVEAAFLLPTFLTLILLALQPVCVLYTRSIMESAAAETARLVVTSADADAMRAFASALGETNASGDVLLEVTVGYEGRPGWLEGDYGEWVAMWG